MAVVDPAQNLGHVIREESYHGDIERLAKLPRNIKRRISALKTIQKEALEVEADFYARIHELEKEYELKFAPIHEMRKQIIAGDREPTEAEASLPVLGQLSVEDQAEFDSKSTPDTNEKGVKDFWLTVLQSHDAIAGMIQDHDEPILHHLTDVSIKTESNPMRFTASFKFSPNPYFKNESLNKVFFLDNDLPAANPFDYDGPAVKEIKGTKIDWYENKDVTTKAMKKKQKKGANPGKYLTKTVPADSFFHFFDETNERAELFNSEDGKDAPKLQDVMDSDFEVGQVLRDTLIPRAVLIYTGEYSADEDMYDYGEDFDDSIASEEEGDDDEH